MRKKKHYRIIDPEKDVPCDWIYEVPETGVIVGPAFSLAELVADVCFHYFLNHIVCPGDVFQRISDYIARGVPSNRKMEIES